MKRFLAEQALAIFALGVCLLGLVVYAMIFDGVVHPTGWLERWF